VAGSANCSTAHKMAQPRKRQLRFMTRKLDTEASRGNRDARTQLTDAE
jgi:hypothetical protein